MAKREQLLQLAAVACRSDALSVAACQGWDSLHVARVKLPVSIIMAGSMNFPQKALPRLIVVFMLGSPLTWRLLPLPLWKWKRSRALVRAAVARLLPSISQVQFLDVAQQAGLTIVPTCGGASIISMSIIEAKGSGLAFFDYDQRRMAGHLSHEW